MKTYYPAVERGLTKLSWLTSFHSFSFNTFYDPKRIHFGPLRVLNDDRVMPGAGFGSHPHENMEIVTYVLEGALEHKDSTGGNGVIHAGEVQRMSAGTGIVHSEYNNSETEPVHLLQIWFIPDTDGLTPGYEQKAFTREQRLNTMLPVASPRMDGPGAHIQQDVTMYIAALEPGRDITHTIGNGRGAYVFLIAGTVDINGATLQPGDAMSIADETTIKIIASRDSDLVLFDLGL